MSLPTIYKLTTIARSPAGDFATYDYFTKSIDARNYNEQSFGKMYQKEIPWKHSGRETWTAEHQFHQYIVEKVKIRS